MKAMALIRDDDRKQSFGSNLSFYWATVYLALFVLVTWLVSGGLAAPYDLAAWILVGLLLAGFLLCVGLGVLYLFPTRALRRSGTLSPAWADSRARGRNKACGCQGQSMSKIGNTYRCEVCGLHQG